MSGEGAAAASGPRRYSPAREELRRVWRDLRAAELSPGKVAAAVGLGLFIGSQPIFGLHTPLVVVLCLLFRLDGAIAWVASNVSNPFFAPFLITAEIQVGALLAEGRLLRLDQEVTDKGAAELARAFAGHAFLGAPVVGLALAILGALLAFVFVAVRRAYVPAKPPEPYRLPPSAPPWIVAVERLASRFAPQRNASPAERSRFHYVRIKLTTDPVARLVAEVEGDQPGVLGEVLDVGTGRGQLPMLLVELGRATRARGIDWDEAKIRAGNAAAGAKDDLAPLDVKLEVADAREALLGEADTVLLVDLLHYFTPEEQDAILERAARAVRPGGRLLVREADSERGLRTTMTLLEERIFTFLRFNRGERVHFRPARELVARLEAAGLVCDVRPAWGKTPFSNVLIVARRPAS